MSWGLELLGNISRSLIDTANNVSMHGYEGLLTPSALTSWRVTPENPVRYANSLDVERCAALHNEILWHGWNASGGQPEDFAVVNWFKFHGDTARGASSRLSSPVAAFLDQALVVNGSHSFFYHVSGLSYPSIMWDTHEWFQPPAEQDRFLTLYTGHSITSHPDGLVYDQIKHKAIMQPSIHDASTAHNGRQTWYPLEVILTAWLDMIQAGKVQAVTDDVHPINAKHDPWIMLPYSERQLNDTVKAFNRLADAIESRMSIQGNQGDMQKPLTPETNSVSSMLSEDELKAAGIPQGFAYSFLKQARRPSFRYVAPGLSIPTSESIKSQPFSSIRRPPGWDGNEDFPNVIYPILIFSSSELYETWRDPSSNPRFPDHHRPFYWPYNELKSYNAGLYFTPTDRESIYEFEDSVKMVLPYPIGGYGYARAADGARFGENREEKGIAGYVQGGCTFADLFQLGYNPYGMTHDVQLERVLDAWTELVESGEWKIGKDGVEDTIQKWKDADTYHKWNKYVVPNSW